MPAPKILGDAGQTPCQMIPLGGTRGFQVRVTGSGTYRWKVTGGLRIKGADNQKTVTVEGQSVSKDVNDQTLTVDVSGTPQTLSLTVVDVKDISVTAPATPQTQNNTACAAMRYYDQKVGRNPATSRDLKFVSTETVEQFPEDRRTVLVLLRGTFPPLSMCATVTPALTAMGWSVARNPDDAPRLSGEPPPTLCADVGWTNLLKLDATGSFFVRAYAQCSCGQRHPDLTRVLRVVLVDVKLTADCTEVFNEFAAYGCDFGYFEFNPIAGQDLIKFDADFEALSGGKECRLYLADERKSAVHGRWCNTALAPPSGAEISATYEDGKKLATMLIAQSHSSAASPTFTAKDPRPAQINYPVCDGSDDITQPQDLNLAGAQTIVKDAGSGVGQKWTGTASDVPNEPFPLLHPEDSNQGITEFKLDYNFIAGFCLWTDSAPWIIGVACTIRWQVQSTWNIKGPPFPDDPDSATRDHWKQRTTVMPSVTIKVATEYTPIAAANDAGIEVWPPGNLQHLAKKTF